MLVEMKESNQPSVEGKSVGASPITSANFSRCRLAAMAAGLHPAITGVRVPPPRPLPGSSTVERPPVKRRDAGANPALAANFVGETASDVTCPTCRQCSEHHRGRRPLCVHSVQRVHAQPAEALRSKALKTERTTTMNAVALVIAWFAVVGLVFVARVAYRPCRPIR